MADLDAGVFASVHVWQDQALIGAFMTSPAIVQVAAEPFLSDLSITAIPFHEETLAVKFGS